MEFLDASSHLYKRVCPSVGRSVGWSVGPEREFSGSQNTKENDQNWLLDASSHYEGLSVHRLVRQSVRPSVHPSVRLKHKFFESQKMMLNG